VINVGGQSSTRRGTERPVDHGHGCELPGAPRFQKPKRREDGHAAGDGLHGGEKKNLSSGIQVWGEGGRNERTGRLERKNLR